MGLFKPAWQKERIYECQESIDKIHRSIDKAKTQEELAVIAKTATLYDAYTYAVKKLTDTAILEDLAKNCEKKEVRECATSKLTNQKLLEYLAFNDEYGRVRENAVRNLNDQSLIGEIALNDADSNVRYTAIYNLNDQTILAEIAKTEILSTLRGKAFDKIKDEKLRDEVKNTKLNEQQLKENEETRVWQQFYRQEAEKQKLVQTRYEQGRCPHCGALLTGWDNYVPRTGIKDNRTHIYTCGACGKRI